MKEMAKRIESPLREDPEETAFEGGSQQVQIAASCVGSSGVRLAAEISNSGGCRGISVRQGS